MGNVIEKHHRFRDALYARLKKTSLVWVAVYPAVLFVLTVLGDLPQDWPLPLRVFIATVVIVPIVTNITEPAVGAILAAVECGLAQRDRLSQP